MVLIVLPQGEAVRGGGGVKTRDGAAKTRRDRGSWARRRRGLFCERSRGAGGGTGVDPRRARIDLGSVARVRLHNL